MPHPSAASFKVHPLYPAAPWNWGNVIPDFVLPASSVSRESIAWSDKPTGLGLVRSTHIEVGLPTAIYWA